MSKPGVLFEAAEMTRAECLSAVNFSALQTQIAVMKMTAFVIAYLDDEPQLVATARRLNREMNALCDLLAAEQPQPWNFVEAGGTVM